MGRLRYRWYDWCLSTHTRQCTTNNCIHPPQHPPLRSPLLSFPNTIQHRPKLHLISQEMVSWRETRRNKNSLGLVYRHKKILVAIPSDKYVSYSKQIKDILSAGKVTNKNLMNIIGRLQRCVYVTPHSQYFMNRLRHLQAITAHTTWGNLSGPVKADLKLWLLFLEKAAICTSIHNFVFRKPPHFFLGRFLSIWTRGPLSKRKGLEVLYTSSPEIYSHEQRPGVHGYNNNNMDRRTRRNNPKPIVLSGLLRQHVRSRLAPQSKLWPHTTTSSRSMLPSFSTNNDEDK